MSENPISVLMTDNQANCCFVVLALVDTNRMATWKQ